MTRNPQRGFSLVEVLVALVITSIGLLGIAKLQAVSYASTGTSSARSLAAIEASSMVSAIRANRSYWSAANALTVQVSSAGVVTSSDGVLATSTYNCQFITGTATNAPCTPNQLAAVDLHNWAASLRGVFTPATPTIPSSIVQGLPDGTANITCANAPTPPPALSGPVTCAITVFWNERTVGVDSQSQGAVASVGSAPGSTKYTLYVVP